MCMCIYIYIHGSQHGVPPIPLVFALPTRPVGEYPILTSSALSCGKARLSWSFHRPTSWIKIRSGRMASWGSFWVYLRVPFFFASWKYVLDTTSSPSVCRGRSFTMSFAKAMACWMLASTILAEIVQPRGNREPEEVVVQWNLDKYMWPRIGYTKDINLLELNE